MKNISISPPRLLSSLLRCPFPQAKRFSPQRLVSSLTSIFSQLRFTDLAKDPSHEAKVVLTALPEFYKSATVLLAEVVKTLGLNLLPLQETVARAALKVLQDLRQFSGDWVLPRSKSRA